MKLEKITIHSHLDEYNVLFDPALKKLQDISNSPNIIYLIDEIVWNLYRESHLSTVPLSKIILIEAKEDNKEFHSVPKIIPRLTELNAKKNLMIVAIGGGIIQDIAGFIASILYRGIKWIYIPTTLLAQSDSCIGAKTSINFLNYKNLLGTFWAPNEIWLSTNFLNTLTTKDFYSGVGEIIKLFLIDGEKSLKYFSSLSIKNEADFRNNIVDLLKKALEIKKGYIEEDEFDRGVRNILNFGHCVGHAIESATNYLIPHGQAITLGIIWANIISERRKILSKEKKEEIYNSFLKNNHTVKREQISFNVAQIVEAMLKDKKREGNNLSIILMDETFHFEMVKDMEAREVIESSNEFFSLF